MSAVLSNEKASFTQVLSASGAITHLYARSREDMMTVAAASARAQALWLMQLMATGNRHHIDKGEEQEYFCQSTTTGETIRDNIGYQSSKRITTTDVRAASKICEITRMD